MKSLVIAAGMTMIAGGAVGQDKPVLNIYAYDSFVADWGPGPVVEEAFEAVCDCDLVFTAAGDGAALLGRIQLEGNRSEADIVLGLDTNLVAKATATGLFAAHGQQPELDLPGAWDDPIFLPFDWGYFAFVHEAELENVPTSFEALAASDLTIIIQDPRSSTPGLGLAYWVHAVHGADAGRVWSELSDNVLTVTKGWSEAYGLFLDGEADMVLSYTTSPSYHLVAEGDPSKAAAIFDEGHYMQIEVAGKLAHTDQPDLADQFLEFMLSDAFQGVIPTTNWMFPAAFPGGKLPRNFAQPLPSEQSLIYSAEDAEAIRQDVLDTWLSALSQ